MQRRLSMWEFGMALGTTALILAVAARQLWLIVTTGGLLMVTFAHGGIGGWLGRLLFWTGLAVVGTGLRIYGQTAKPTSSP